VGRRSRRGGSSQEVREAGEGILLGTLARRTLAGAILIGNRVHAYTHSDICPHSHSHTPVRILTHTHTHSHTLTHTHTHSHTLTLTFPPTLHSTHTRLCTHTHSHSHYPSWDLSGAAAVLTWLRGSDGPARFPRDFVAGTISRPLVTRQCNAHLMNFTRCCIDRNVSVL
jgi:hypothetical protein